MGHQALDPPGGSAGWIHRGGSGGVGHQVCWIHRVDPEGGSVGGGSTGVDLQGGSAGWICRLNPQGVDLQGGSAGGGSTGVDLQGGSTWWDPSSQVYERGLI